jgi:hypothetical protein
MESFFTPTRHLQDRHDYLLGEPLRYTEVQLAVSIETFLNHPWDWSVFHAFATGDGREMWKFLWITEDTLLWVEDGNNGVNFVNLMQDYAIQQASFTAPSGETHVLFLAMKRGSSSLSAKASSIFWHAMTTSNCVKLRLDHWHWFSGCIGLCSGPALSQFLEASPSLELLEFIKLDFEEAHCRAFANLERTDLEVTFQRCPFEAQGAKGTFIEWLRHSQVVAKLENCGIEDSIISALSGNSSVKILSIDAITNDYNVRSLARALPGNLGIERLSVSLSDENDETWCLLLRSLWAHPGIHSVSLSYDNLLSAASKTSMMNAALRLVQCNTLVHTIDLPDNTNDEEFFQNVIVPRLEMNRNCFEDQRQALTQADSSIRDQLLGRACTSSVAIPIYCFDFSRRMSQLSF